MQPNANDPETGVVAEWLEDNVGGKVVSISRQPRWRPQWIADVETGSETIALMVRGERYDTDMVWPLRHEYDFQRLMWDAGVKTPKVYGWIDKPACFVMERVPGSSWTIELPGPERDTIVAEYVAELAKLHTLDTKPFLDAGIDRAAARENPATIGFIRMNDLYRRQKHHYDPQMDFFIDWLGRNPVRPNVREAPIVWDSGQFMHEGGHFTSIIDVELGHLGDPMMDLAGWRMRDSIMDFGDFNKIYDQYSNLVGEPVDIKAIEWHHIYFTLSNQLAFTHARVNPPVNSDFATNMQWCNETNLYATEALAEYLDIELPTVAVPADEDTLAAPAIDHLVKTLSTLRIDDAYVSYRLRGAFREARHIQRWDQIGRELVNDDLDDLGAFLGKRPGDFHDGERMLEEFVNTKNTGGKFDVELCQLFHKRNLRAQMLNGPLGSAMARHIPIQSFRS
jgi:aminoglycoside phosphotransferase (APT) family kinase protein